MADNTPQVFCQRCNRQYDSIFRLKDHKYYSPSHPFYCRSCDIEFPTRALMTEHFQNGNVILQAEEGGNHHCKLCRLSFPSFLQFANHLRNVDRHRNICHQCYLAFHDQYLLEGHIARSHPPPPSIIQPNIEPLASAPERPSTSIELINQTLATLSASTRPPPPSPPTLMNTAISVALPPRRYPCTLCKTEYESLQALEQHNLQPVSLLASGNKSSGKVTCLPCKRDFSNIASMKTHCRETARHRNSCIICFLEFHTEIALQQHNLSSHPGPSVVERSQPAASSSRSVPPPQDSGRRQPEIVASYFCSRCKTRFESQEALTLHLKLGLPIFRPQSQIQVACMICDVVLHNNPENLTQHVRDSQKHSNSCISCMLDFHNAEGLKDHASRHLNPVAPPGPIREQNTTSSAAPLPAQRNNQRNNTRPPRFPCLRCRGEFSTQAQLQEHCRTGIPITSQNGNQAGEVECLICRKSFRDMRALIGHLSSTRIHDGACVTCLLDFHSLEGLEAHSNTTHAPATASHPVPDPPAVEGNGLSVARQNVLDTTPSSRPNPPRDQNPYIGTYGNGNIALRSNLDQSNNNRRPTIPTFSESSTSDDSESDHLFSQSSSAFAPSYPRLEEPDPWGLQDAPRVRNPGPRGTRDSYAGRTGRNIPHLLPSFEEIVPCNARRTKSSTKTTNQRGTAPSGRKCIYPIPCPLCLDIAVDLTSTHCGHVGCEACLVESLKAKPECPICRKPTTISEIHPIFL